MEVQHPTQHSTHYRTRNPASSWGENSAFLSARVVSRRAEFFAICRRNFLVGPSSYSPLSFLDLPWGGGSSFFCVGALPSFYVTFQNV